MPPKKSWHQRQQEKRQEKIKEAAEKIKTLKKDFQNVAQSPKAKRKPA
jgi:hypothetical protein